VIRSKDRDGVHAQTGEDTSCRPGRAAGRGGESVHEVNASDHGLREEALLVQGGRGLDERPARLAAQVQPGCGTAARDGCPLNAERVEPELAGVAVGPASCRSRFIEQFATTADAWRWSSPSSCRSAT
jgi:hypothetical protein